MQPQEEEVQVFSIPEPEEHLEAAQESLGRMALKTFLGIAVVISVIALAASSFRPELEALSRRFLQRFGVLGMLAGSFLADAFHFPVPPQFYLLTAVSSRCPQLPALAAISAGSMLGGVVAYRIGAVLSSRRFARRWFLRTEERIHSLFRRYRYWAVVLAGLSPVTFPMLCNTAGFYRMPHRILALFIALRLPRLLFFYALIRFGWGR